MKTPTLAVMILASALAPFAGAKEEAKKTAVEFPMDPKPLERVNTGGRLASYADVLEKVTPAVVSITTSQVVRQMPRGRGDMDEFLRRFWGLPSPQAQPEDDEQPQRGGRGGSTRKVPLGCEPSFSPVAAPSLAHHTGRCMARLQVPQTAFQG